MAGLLTDDERLQAFASAHKGDDRLGHSNGLLTWQGRASFPGWRTTIPTVLLDDEDFAEELAHWMAEVDNEAAPIATGDKAQPKTTDADPEEEQPELWHRNKNGTYSLNSLTLAQMVCNLGPIRVGPSGEFWAYEKGTFSPARHVVRNRVAAILGNRYSRDAVARAADHISSTADTIDLDGVVHPDWINFTNGMVNYKTGEMVEHSEDFGSYFQLTTAWTPGAECPMFDAWVEKMIPAEFQTLLWQVIGYSMLSHNPQQVFVYLDGPGGNGKGVVQRLIRALVGPKNASSVAWKDIDGDNRFKLSQMVGKAVNIGGEVPSEYVKDSSNLKAITGSDSLNVESKGQDGYNTSIHALLIFAGNDVPRLADDSDGLFQRLILMPFPNPAKENPVEGFDEAKLVDEFPGIANKAVAALADIEWAPNRRADVFATNSDLQDAKAKFQEATNAELDWVRNYTAKQAGHWSTPMELYRAFGGTGQRVSRKFARTLERVYGEPLKRTPTSFAQFPNAPVKRTGCYEVAWFEDRIDWLAKSEITEAFGGAQ